MQIIPKDHLESEKLDVVVNFLILYKGIMLKVCLSIILICCFFGGCQPVNNFFSLPSDNIIEQGIEKIFENETGLNIDLTPEENDEFFSDSPYF